MSELKKRAWLSEEMILVDVQSQKVQEVSGMVEELEPPKLEIVKGYPKSYLNRIARIKAYKAVMEVVGDVGLRVWEGFKYRAVAYPVVIYKGISGLVNGLLTKARESLRWTWGIAREVAGRLMSGNLREYATTTIQGVEMRPSPIGRWVAISIVTAYYATKIATRSRGILIIPVVIGGYIAYRLVATGEGFIASVLQRAGRYIVEDATIPEGVKWVAIGGFALVSLVISGIYIYFGYMKRYQFKGIRKKYFGWLSLRINTPEEIEELKREEVRYSDNS